MSDQTDPLDLGFELLPADEAAAVSADDALNAASASALDDDDVAPEEEEAPEPFGVSWEFDFEAGRFVRQGGAPARVTGFAALRQWCMMALNSVRGAHVIFSDEFGIEAPPVVGTAGVEAEEAADDYVEAARDALLVHDRIADVSLEATYDPVAGVIVVTDFVVVTDEEAELPFADLSIDPDVTEEVSSDA